VNLKLTFLSQDQNGPEPVNEDGSPFVFTDCAPVVLFCKKSPPFEKVMLRPGSLTPGAKRKRTATLLAGSKKVKTSRRLLREGPLPSDPDPQVSIYHKF
jgi:hypothetical protein